MTAVNKIAVVPHSEKVFDQIEAAALMKTDNEEAGAVLAITKEVGEGNVDLLLVFPTQVDTAADDKLAVGERYQPTAIRMTLNTFLNTARMLAIQHKAVVGEVMPEAYTDEHADRIIVPGRTGHGS